LHVISFGLFFRDNNKTFAFSNIGLIYIVNQLDYETRSKYELVVRATDSVSGVHSEVPVSVSVEDANDSPPEFSHNEYNVTLSEATPFGTTVLAVTAIDQDSGKDRNKNK